MYKNKNIYGVWS